MSSFYELLRSRDYAASPAYQGGFRNQGPTKRQIDTYLEMCKDRLLQPVNYTTFSVAEMSKEINRILSLRSRKQIDKIHEKIQLIKGLGINLDTFLMSVEFDELTGGREGTASKLIETLFAIEKECNVMLPPTDKQLDILQEWMLCPDIPFEENFDIHRTKELTDIPRAEGGLWRRLTPEEFRNQCAVHLKRNEASKLIDEYRGVFFEWRKTRVTPTKIAFIRDLESRLASIYTPKEKEVSVDIVGNRVVAVTHKVTDKSSTYNPTAFSPMSNDEIVMLSDDEAEMYIDTLKAEQRHRYYAFQKSDNELTFEEIRTVQNVDDIEDSTSIRAGNTAVMLEMQHKALQDCVFRLEAIGGYANDEAHELSPEFLREYMLYLIDEGYITIQGMAELIRDSTLMQDLLLGRSA